MGIRKILIKRAWLIFTVVLSLITGVVIGHSLKCEPTFLNISASLGLTVTWVISMLFSVFREAKQNEKEQNQERIKQEGILVIDLKKWIDKTEFAKIVYSEGSIRILYHKDPDSLPYYDEAKKVLEGTKIYRARGECGPVLEQIKELPPRRRRYLETCIMKPQPSS